MCAIFGKLYFHTNFFYFSIIGSEITKNGVEITPALFFFSFLQLKRLTSFTTWAAQVHSKAYVAQQAKDGPNV